MQNYSEELNFSKEIAFEAGKILSKHFGNIKTINKKSSYVDLVTKADLKSENLLVRCIQKKFPKHNIITEESDLKENKSDFRWVLDPLDGTTNFVHNLPIFAVSIGLQYRKKTILGVVYNPAADKMFYASKNNNSYLNGNLINISSSKTLSDSLIVTGFPYLKDDKWDKSFDIFKDIYSQTRGVRRLGAAALDLCFVAMGRFEAFYEFNLKPWDICAGAIIAKEAGASVTDWNNKPYQFSGNRILATNTNIHKAMVDILTKDDYKVIFEK